MRLRKRSKFGVDVTPSGKKKRTFEGRVFDSELELKIYRDYLLPLKASGDILDIKLQKEYILQKGFTKNGKKILPIKYIADYVITYADGHVEVWDAKGRPDATALMKRKMFDYVYSDLILRWVCISLVDGGIIDYDDLQKARKERKKAKKK